MDKKKKLSTIMHEELERVGSDKLVQGNSILGEVDGKLVSFDAESFGNGGASVIKAVYNVTPFEEVKAAIDEGNVVEVDYSRFTFDLCFMDGNSATFGNVAKAANGKIYQKFIKVVRNNEWSYESKAMASEDQLPEVYTKSEIDDMIGNVEGAIATIIDGEVE